MWEFNRAFSSAHNSSPGPDGISYELLRHLNEDSIVSLLYLFNRIWKDQVYPTQCQKATVIPILKPGIDPKNPLSYRPIALTSYDFVRLHPNFKENTRGRSEAFHLSSLYTTFMRGLAARRIFRVSLRPRRRYTFTNVQATSGILTHALRHHCQRH
ncbi:RNA-directed DNA polymerase from mobile element jockey [Trichonephila clavipes]|nr:RNA-directed DNA polymerase from mobile element jockey [Trichonephila clavipes]